MSICDSLLNMSHWLLLLLLLLYFIELLHSFLSLSHTASLVFFCAVCMLHVAQSEDEGTDYEMNDYDDYGRALVTHW